MRILQVSMADRGGGAEGVARRLHDAYRKQGEKAWLAVSVKRSEDADILQIPVWRPRNPWAVRCRAISRLLKPSSGESHGHARISRLFYNLSEPLTFLRRELGHEIFDYPGSRQLLNLPPQRPDIVHCHNLHGPLLPRGGYFDLKLLPWLSRQVPVVMTLHDMWLLTGHCAHAFDCDRWKTGCHHCPDLSVYPAIRRDATAHNWRVKKKIYAKCRLFVTTPSLWLMRRAGQSMLQPGIAEAKVIPNGVDLSVFHPGDKEAARSRLGLPPRAAVLLFAANTIRNNIWKDFVTMRDAIALASAELEGRETIFIALGEDAPPETIGRAQIHFVPYQRRPEDMASYYQAADIYLHAARAEVWGLTITEAMACATPVVATGVGGIPEQVRDGVNGFLVAPQDSRTMADRVVMLLGDEARRQSMAQEAHAIAAQHWPLDLQAKRHLDWYGQIRRRWEAEGRA